MQRVTMAAAVIGTWATIALVLIDPFAHQLEALHAAGVEARYLLAVVIGEHMHWASDTSPQGLRGLIAEVLKQEAEEGGRLDA